MTFRSSTFRGWLQSAWNSDCAAPLRFYGWYFRWPLLLLLLALAVEKLVYYGALPLGGIAEREWAYYQAGRDLDAGLNTAALYQIREALIDTRDNARLWRRAARISERLDLPEAAYCWQQVDRIEPGSFATQQALAETALRHNELDLAAAALREVATDRQGSLGYLVDAGRLAQAEGDEARAGFFLEKAEALRPDDAPNLFALADWRVTRGEPDRARALLNGLLGRANETAPALRKLIDLEMQQHHLVAARWDEVKLLALPGASFADALRQLDLASDNAALSATLHTLLHIGTKPETARVLDWMTTHRRAEEALIWIRRQDESWQDDPDIGLARAGCLKALGEWQHLSDDQSDSRWPGRESARLMVLTQASRALGRTEDARAAWHRAVGACDQPTDFTALANAAGDFPDDGEARAEVWIALVNRYPGQQWPLRSWLNYELRRGDLVAAQNVAVRLAALAPGDVALTATQDLICLRRGSQVAQVEADLARVDAQQPGDATVATAAAYSLYLQGRFADALATIGALEPAELRAADLGQMLAAAGPVAQAGVALQTALAQPNLLDEQRREIQRALDLVTARRVMTDLIHPRNSTDRDRARAFFISQAPMGKAVWLIGASVAQAGNREVAAASLAQIDPASLNRPELVLEEGAVLALAGPMLGAEPYLMLSSNLPVESSVVAWHRIVEAWWAIEKKAPFEPTVAAGLLSAYRGLESEERDPMFWIHDEARELALTRTALQDDQEAGPVQRRLEALLRHVPATPDLEAQIGYALFLQGRVEAGRQRIEVLSATDLGQPEPARYYAAILRACGETKRAQVYTLLASRDTPHKEL